MRWIGAIASVERFERDEELAGLGDRIDTILPARSMRCATMHDDIVPGEALMGDHQIQMARFGIDRGSRLEDLKHLECAEGGVLLVSDTGDDDIACDPGL